MRRASREAVVVAGPRGDVSRGLRGPMGQHGGAAVPACLVTSVDAETACLIASVEG